MSIGLSDWNDEKNQSTLKWAIKAKKKRKTNKLTICCLVSDFSSTEEN